MQAVGRKEINLNLVEMKMKMQKRSVIKRVGLGWYTMVVQKYQIIKNKTFSVITRIQLFHKYAREFVKWMKKRMKKSKIKSIHSVQNENDERMYVTNRTSKHIWHRYRAAPPKKYHIHYIHTIRIRRRT